MGQEPIYYHAGAALAEVNNREDGYYFNCMSKKPEDLAFMEKITDNSWWKNLED
ncbi:MAG: hypothetical protein IH845_05730 [Nanoarchaeota archaeon]|nr:hypothetical protein [Nanoarchaeota archaeon]